jgi:glucose/arabinose dehydrogenase/PKD repeat protein
MRVRRVLTVVALVGATLTIGSGPARAITLPAGFADELVATLSQPTAFDWTPDGRILVTTKDAHVYVLNASGAVLATALDLSARTCSNSERGFLGIDVSPDFATTGHVFLYYTSKNPATAAGVCDNTAFNRVARFTMSGNTLGSELVLVDRMRNYNGNHNAGDVKVGNDGFVYFTVGDGGCNYAVPTNCAGNNNAARTRHHMLGKVGRVTKAGAVPASNPFQGAGTARCNAGLISAGMICQEIFAWGLRNPFRFAFDPNVPTTTFFINDVGQAHWEEIDLGTAGADYGWNVREGHCATGSSTNCGTVPGMVNPIHDYSHTTGCGSITGGAFIPNGVWPGPYDGDYLFADYVCGKIFLRDRVTGQRSAFATQLGSGSAVHLAFGPHFTTQALYYTTFRNGGELRRIRHTGGNTPPTASFTANPTFGPAPLNVSFNASASSDVDGDVPLTYEWTFGDGATQSTSSATTSHTYAAGTYTAQLVVRDSRGLPSAPTTRQISSGNSPPSVTMSSPAAASKFFVDEVITLTGSATDPEDGAMPDSALTWEVRRIHGTHFHPWFNGTGNNRTFAAPAPEDQGAVNNSWLEVRLTVTDSGGLATTVVRTVLPKKVSLTFKTNPTGKKVIVNGTTYTAPKTITSWQGWQFPISANDQGQFKWKSWSDGGARTHIITTPAVAKTYTATFQRQLV